MTDVYQIYYRDDQLPKLYPFAIPYKNERLTVFFENAVIVKLVSETTAERVGVCSWALRDKYKYNIPPCREITKELIETEYDILSLTKNTRNHAMLAGAERWHKGFKDIFNKIWLKLGRKYPAEPKNPIYQNHFVARTEIYRRYLAEILIPVMDLMENDQEIRPRVYEDSNYYKLTGNRDFAARVKSELLLDYCPLHAFLCERMFPVWASENHLPVTYI